MTSPQTQSLRPPGEFVEQVHTALDQLYDFAFLQTHPLAQRKSSEERGSAELAGHLLRRELIDAIETLNPGRDMPFLSSRSRLFHLLHMHYVEGITVQKAADGLGISLRQAHRDLRRAEESVAAIVWAHRSGESLDDSVSAASMVTWGEGDQLKSRMRLIDLNDIVEHGRKEVRLLIEARGLRVDYAPPIQPILALTDPVIAQQIWISLLSYSACHAQAGSVLVQLQLTDDKATIALRYTVAQGQDHHQDIDPAVSQLAARLDWVLKVEDDPATATHSVNIQIPTRKRTVLAIDDDAGMAELIERYLTGQDCQVVTARNGWQGVQMAQALLPEVIVLDVMMPDMDGWEVLQTLRDSPSTSWIQAVICSVIYNSELAASLGVTLYLTKPLRRVDLLNALHQVGVV